MKHSESSTPEAVIVSRLKQLRARHGWSAAVLAERCAELGIPELSRSVIANIEIGRRPYVTVSDLLVLALALGVAPVHLAVPLDDDTPIQLTPKVTRTSEAVRDWVVGRHEIDLEPPSDSLVVVARESTYWDEQPTGWDFEEQLKARVQRMVWFAVGKATNDDGTVDADTLERELSHLLGGL